VSDRYSLLIFVICLAFKLLIRTNIKNILEAMLLRARFALAKYDHSKEQQKVDSTGAVRCPGGSLRRSFGNPIPNNNQMGDQKRSNEQVHARPRGLFQEFECLAALKDPPDLLLFLVLGLTLPSGDSGFAKLSWLERAANILNERRCQIVIILLTVTAPCAAFLRLGPAPRSALSRLLCCAHNNTATPVPVRGKQRPRRGGCRWKPTPWQWCEAERAGASHGISPVT
jgi:hypothetical protein